MKGVLLVMLLLLAFVLGTEFGKYAMQPWKEYAIGCIDASRAGR